MKSLTVSQLEFLQRHDVPMELVYDARGLSRPEYRRQMKRLNKIVAFNVSPCIQFGHTLRSRSGHCIQCDPTRLAFQKRNEMEGIVYVAETKTGRKIKVGFSGTEERRRESLNRTQYGGFEDWETKFVIKSSKAGKIENAIKVKLRKFSCHFQYNHDGHSQKAGEIFTCPSSTAVNAILTLCGQKKIDYTILRYLDSIEPHGRDFSP